MVKVKLPKSIQFSVSNDYMSDVVHCLLGAKARINYTYDDYMTLSFHNDFLYVYIQYETACKIVSHLKQMNDYYITNNCGRFLFNENNLVIKYITTKIADDTEFEGDDNERS